MSEEKIKDLLKYRFNIVPVYLSTQNIQEGVPQLINKELALKYVLIPFKQSSFRLLVAMADPFDTEAIEEVQKVTGLTVLPRKAEANEIMEMIEHFYADESADEIETEENEETIENEEIEQAEKAEENEEEETKGNEEIQEIQEEKLNLDKELKENEIIVESENAEERQDEEISKVDENREDDSADLETKMEEEKAAKKIVAKPSFKEKLLGRNRRDNNQTQLSQQEKVPTKTIPNVLNNDVHEQLEEIKGEINQALLQEEVPKQKNEDLLANVFGRKDDKKDVAKNALLGNKDITKKESKEETAIKEQEKQKEKVAQKEVKEEIRTKDDDEQVQKVSNESQQHFENKTKIGTLLLESELIEEEQLNSAIKIQKRTKQKLGEILVDHQMVDEDDFVQTLSKQTGIPSIKLSEMYINPEIPTLIKESLARKYLLIPMRIEKGQLHVAMADPLNVYAIDDVKIATGFNIVPYIAGKKDITRAIDQYYGQLSTEEAIEDLMKEMDTEVEDVRDKEVLNTINNAPLVRLVNSLLRQAVTMKASDVHIEPFEGVVRVRFRVDGDLQEIMNLDINTHPAVVARIKIMGKMDIAEKRVPQDGRVEIRVEERKIDLRLSTLPTAFGEKIVIRILDKEGASFNRKKLGFSKEALERLDTIIHNSCGIILVTGPTGSGKSSTLYTILTELNKVNRNIITVEDPIEYRMVGVNQVQVNHKAGLDFASGLRSILRQDPDIIMVGEIRDTETVQIAVRAAITGHLVLSTIHTNDTASTISRLEDMGVEPYLISSSIVGIIAQRLVKKICPDCKTEYQPNDFERMALGLAADDVAYKGKGCANCNNTGYKGRTAIAEIMDINFEIKKMINEKRSTEDIKVAAAKKGMITLQDSCRKLVLEGITTVDEYFRNAYVVE